MNGSALGTIGQLRALLEGTLSVAFAPFADGDARCAPIASVVRPTPGAGGRVIRIDSVHQGDQDGTKGVYRINALAEGKNGSGSCARPIRPMGFKLRWRSWPCR
ncbi:MAG: hypothetical protein ACK40S_12470 [Burkholderiaceae bacterium]